MAVHKFSPSDRKDTTKIICATRKKVAVVRVRVNVGVILNCLIVKLIVRVTQTFDISRPPPLTEVTKNSGKKFT